MTGNAIRLGAAMVLAFLASAARAELTDEQLLSFAEHKIQESAARWGVNALPMRSDSGEVKALPSGQVRISAPALREILGDAPDNEADALLAWVMAHEVWHQVQFGRGVDMMKADDPAKRSFECEADIMGAYAVLSRELARLEDPNEEQQRALVARLDRIVGVAQRLEMGINGAFTHPNADQRLTAIRSGAGRAVYELPKLVQASAEVGLVRDRLARIHDIRTGEDAAAWSGRMCRLILHPGAAVPSIAMDKPVFQWSKSADQPYVDYSIPYRNNGSSPIHMTVVIRAASILRSDREKQAAWIYSDASRNEFDVEPGGTYNVAGRLQWYATEERMPRLVYPHVPGSLFDADVLAASTSSQSAPSPTMLDPSPELLNLQSALQALYTDAPNHFRNRAPPCPSEYGMETCPLPIAIDGVISSEVNRYEDGSSEAYLELYRGTSELEAIAAYDAFRNKLVRIYPSLNFTPTTRPNGSVQIVLKPFLKVELTLSRRMRDNGTWIVSAIIEPKFY